MRVGMVSVRVLTRSPAKGGLSETDNCAKTYGGSQICRSCIIAKPQPRCAQPLYLMPEVFYNQLDPVPTARSWLSAIRHQPPSRAGLPTQQQAQRTAYDVCEGWRGALV